MKQVHDEFEDVFWGIHCFESTFTLEIKEESNHTKHHQGSLYIH